MNRCAFSIIKKVIVGKGYTIKSRPFNSFNTMPVTFQMWTTFNDRTFTTLTNRTLKIYNGIIRLFNLLAYFF